MTGETGESSPQIPWLQRLKTAGHNLIDAMGKAETSTGPLSPLYGMSLDQAVGSQRGIDAGPVKADDDVTPNV